MPKISILIPAYNVEKYIARCLESVLGQTFEDIEVIVVNDCSTDGTRGVVNEFISRDPRVKLIDHEENYGVCWARKTLVEASEGDYLMFVDSDDTIKPNACERLYSEAIENDADLVIACYELCFSDGRRVAEANKLDHGNDTRGIVKAMLMDELKRYLWAKLYMRRLLVDNPPEYLKHFNLCEDEIISFTAALNVQKAVCIPDVVYEYYQFGKSLTHNTNLKLFGNMMRARAVVKDVCFSVDEELGKMAEVYALKGIHFHIKAGKDRKEVLEIARKNGFSGLLSFHSLVSHLGLRKGITYFLVMRFSFVSRLLYGKQWEVTK